jgi:hypothetical protein
VLLLPAAIPNGRQRESSFVQVVVKEKRRSGIETIIIIINVSHGDADADNRTRVREAIVVVSAFRFPLFRFCCCCWCCWHRECEAVECQVSDLLSIRYGTVFMNVRLSLSSQVVGVGVVVPLDSSHSIYVTVSLATCR